MALQYNYRLLMIVAATTLVSTDITHLTGKRLRFSILTEVSSLSFLLTLIVCSSQGKTV